MKKTSSNQDKLTISKAEYQAFLGLKDAINILEDTISQLKEQVASQNVLLKHYEEELKLSKQRRFGRSSEKFKEDENQMSLEDMGLVFNEAEATASDVNPEDEVDYEEVNYRRAKPTKSRKTKEENLEPFITETIVHTLEGKDLECPNCEHEMAELKVLDRYEVIWKPATFESIKHKEQVYVCHHCEKEGTETPIVVAEGFKPFLPKSSFAAETIAFLINQKYKLSLPLYRIEKDMESQYGFFFSRQTMSNLLLKTTDIYLEKIYEYMIAELLKQSHLHADETSVQVLRELGRKASTKSYMWLYRTGRAWKPIVVYDYRETRGGKHPKEFLQDYKGYLQVDGYQGYEKLSAEITLVGCFAHARRPFAELKKLAGKASKNSITEKALDYLGQLFAIEKKLKERYATFDDKALEAIAEVRAKQSKPIVDEYFNFLEEVYPTTTGKLKEAISYNLGQKDKLKAFLEDPRLELDNNRAERSIKPFVIGRKNWMFSNTPRGARSSAIIYSLVITAEENKLRLYDYLVYLFKNLQALREQDNLNFEAMAPFMPWSDSIPDELFSRR